MSFAISETVKWTEKMEYGKFDLIDRNFLINEIRGNCGLKVSVNLRRTEKNMAEMKMKVIEGAETLIDPVDITLDYLSLDGSGFYCFNSVVSGLNVESLILGYSNDALNFENFRRAHAMIKSESVAYTMTFRFNLKKLVATPKPKKIHEKLYLDQEISDVKIDCKEGKISKHNVY